MGGSRRLIEGGAQAHQVANATIRAAEGGLRRASKDAGVIASVWLLLQIPHAARSETYPASLRDCGLPLRQPPTLMELVGAFTGAVDAQLPNNRGRTDLGEMAQMAAAESLVRVVGAQIRNLYDTGPEEVRGALAELYTASNFGHLTRRFIARLTFKCLDYFLSRALADHVGQGQRFTTLAQQDEFCRALETHCEESAYVLHRFSGKWARKERWEAGDITPDAARRFTGGAMAKMIDALKQGESSHDR